MKFQVNFHSWFGLKKEVCSAVNFLAFFFAGRLKLANVVFVFDFGYNKYNKAKASRSRVHIKTSYTVCCRSCIVVKLSVTFGLILNITRKVYRHILTNGKQGDNCCPQLIYRVLGLKLN